MDSLDKVKLTSQTAWETQKQLNDNFSKIETAFEEEVPTKTSELTNDGDGNSYQVHDGYSSFASTSDYVGYYVLASNTYTKVTTANKDSLDITAGTTIAYEYSPFATLAYVKENGGKIDSISVNNTPQTIDANKNVNITVPTQASDVGALPNSTKYGASVLLSINSSTYVVTLQLKDQDGNNLGTAQTIDLPLESVVVSGSYDSSTKEVVLTLEGGSTIRFSVADLVSGLQTEITSSNKLSADLVDDTNTSNKFVTATEKSTWSGKQDAITSGNKLSADLIEDGTTNKVFTATEQTKLSGIESGAEANVQSDWNQSDSSADDYIKNKPAFPTDITFTASDAGWSAVDANGFYTLTITSDKKPFVVYNSSGEQVMAGLKYDGTYVYVITDTKFSGTVSVR